MATTDRTTAASAVTRRPGMLVAAAVALILIIGVGGLALVLSNDTASEIDTAMGAYEAINNGDVEGYFALLTAEFAEQDRAETQSDFELLVALNQRVEVVEPCQVVEPSSPGETRVQCTVVETNDFFGAGGFLETTTEIFLLDADGRIDDRITVASEGGGVQWAAFSGSFWVWLEKAHPGVYAQIRPTGPNSGAPPGYRTDPSYARIGLEYVEEFVEQSNAYPLESDL